MVETIHSHEIEVNDHVKAKTLAKTVDDILKTNKIVTLTAKGTFVLIPL